MKTLGVEDNKENDYTSEAQTEEPVVVIKDAFGQHRTWLMHIESLKHENAKDEQEKQKWASYELSPE